MRSLAGSLGNGVLVGERAKRARHSQVCSIENRGYIIYIYLYHVTSSVIYVIGRKVWVMVA